MKFPSKQQPKNAVKEERKSLNQRRASLKENVESTLRQLDEITDEEFLADFISILESQQRELEIGIQDAVNSNNELEINSLMVLADKIAIAINRSRSKKNIIHGSSSNQKSSLTYKTHISEKNSSPQFDIFDLDIAPGEKFEPAILPPSKPSNFFTHQPIIVNSPRNTSNFFPENRKSENEDLKDNQALASLQLENSQLKEALGYMKGQIYEKDIALQNLNKLNSDLVNQKDQIYLSLQEAKKKIEKLELELQRNLEVKKNLEIDFNSKLDLHPIEDSKQYEKKSALDFDLDFILSPPSNNKTQSPQIPQKVEAPAAKKLPRLFESSSSSEELEPEIIASKPENDIAFRMGNCMEMGLLLDNEYIQIGFQLKRQSNEIFCMIFIANKSTEPITEIVTEIMNVSMEALPMIIQPIKSSEEILQNAQAMRMIKAQLCDFTSKVANLKISIQCKTIRNYTLKLPITITRFIESRQELPTSIWME